jgi:hypothetical protein
VPAFSAAIGWVTLMFWALTGFEGAAVVRDPACNVARATVLGVLLPAMVYVPGTTVVLGIVPLQRLRTTHAPFSDAVQAMLGAGAALLFTVLRRAQGLGRPRRLDAPRRAIRTGGDQRRVVSRDLRVARGGNVPSAA